MHEFFQAVVLAVWLCGQVQAFFEYEFNVISSGADYTLAVQTDGTPLSWGFPFSERGKAYVPLGYLWTYMRAGISHSCGITNASETVCWGRQREGQCDVPAGYSFLQLTLGKAHTCGITDGAELLCWGSPIDEMLAVPPGHTWSQVDAGTVSTCGVNGTGTILCWGKQGYGRQAVPYLDNADVTWQEVACGDRHCCGLLEPSAVQVLNRRQEDNVICWGDDSNAQLQVPGKEEGRTGTQEIFTSISAGNYHTCGLTLGMDVWCWGRVDQYGLNFQTPGNATILSSGGIHACVIDTNKKAKCWGGNTVGQATIPVDAATYPPSIMEFANDPFDIMEEDSSVRLTPYIAGYTEPKRTYQHIMMAILFPEFALTDSPLLTFEHIDGTEDPYSPHIIKFPESWNAPTINQLQVSALDLTLWYDIRLGASPAIRNITSTWVNGTTEHRLVDGGAYSVRLQYQDTFNHPVATHWIQRYEVTYDLETLAPTLWSPTSGEVKQGITVGYYLEEDMNPDDVWIIMTFTGPSSAQDTNSPYQIQLEKAVTYKGNHSFQLVLGNLYELLDGRPSPYVRQILTANGVGGNGTSLVSGGNYDMVLRVSDTFFNAAKSVQVSGLDFIWDIATETVQRLQPVQVVNDPIVIEYTLPEPVLSGSLRFVLTWIQNTNESTAQADVQSPHTWWVRASKERDVTVGATSNILRLSASNLFRDPDNEALPHPDITKFESRGTPVYSTLQPFSEYVLTISYQDIFGNPRSTLNVTLPTNFTPPGAPSAPTMRSRTTTSLEIGWTRGETGGLRIIKYDLQLFAAPDPPLWWNGTNQEAADYAANGVGNVLQEQEVVGQESNKATFRNLNSSHHYVVRLRAWSKSGVSDWSSWSILRVLSACSDGLPHDGEACDDGNMLDGDGCSSSCVVEMGWTCEAQPAGLYADGWGRGRSRCVAAGMDGLRVGSEECDDCNLQAGDGCDNGKVEPGHICIYQGRLGIETGCPGVLAADTNNYLTFTADDCRIPCGDGIRHIVAGEECDDGNIINGDGCTSDCRIETGYTCPTVGWPQVLLTPCRAICGDGLRLGEEECDDNNTVAGDGCGPDCKVELGWFCKRKPDDTGEVCLNTCLNGIIDPGEECDDANTFSDDGCANCIVEPGWSCEVIANRQTSTSSGSFCVPVCGDGFRIKSGPMAEQCDDGNNLAGDGCDPSCRIETGWTCVSQASEVNTTALRCEPVCGDGLLVVGEGCDDGNKDSGDGCSASCQVERGFVCSPEDYLTKSEVATGLPFAAQNRTICIPICGDGLVLLTFGEACDDGNRVPGDGCDENCAIEPGYTCGSGGVSSSSVCSPICGDGLLRSPEQCDDGNTGKGDGCNEQCQFEQGYQCWPPGVPCRFLCGDSLRLEGEACDDGNLALEDGCDSTCQVEDGWSCSSYIYDATNTTSVCSPICGDGKIRGAEACDDGNLAQGDGCDENCSVEAGWICCDPAPGTTGSRCSVGLPVDRDSICGVTCGNGQRDNGEACDDGNLIAADGCSPGCEVEAGFVCMPMGQQRPGRKIPDFCEAICGDGLLVVGEECDDGNQVSGDGCGPTCKIEQSGTACPQLSDSNGAVCRPTCGDGIRGPGEECDDANSFSGDGCSKDCLVERGFFCSGGGMRSRDTCWPICGDGLRVDGAFSATLAADKLEGCDTGAIPSRGCDAATCQVRPGWTCARPSGPGAEVCSPVCGDGIVISPMEECDDNNNLPGDGCSPDCKVEALYECSYSSFFLRSVCQIRCGDGRKHPSEACDDGNNWDQDGCSSDCQLEAGFECLGGTLASPSECKAICGDGFEVHGEGCDDGNLVPWDGCNQFCQVEDGYHCTRAPSPGGQGVVGCSKSCGDGIQNYNEECDDAAPGSSSSCFQCRKVPETVCGDFRRTDSEECDDGNTASGDGCSSSCTLEPGWNCVKGPSHLSPGTAPGDVCTPVCGDGLVVTGEACDDGNYRGDDGCTGDCQVEPLYDCFLPGATELLQVPASERPSNGPAASICVRTTPPRLQGARFDESFVTLELQFDSRVAPLPGEEYSGGVALAATSFSCSVLVDQNTLRLLGQGPRCWWKSRQVAAIALGSAPGLVPGSAVTLQAGVLRRYVFSQVTAPSQELKADVAGGMTAPVLWPRPVIWGPQLVPSCADSTILNSDNSQGLAGRMALPSRWYVAGAFNITNGSWDSEELTRIEAGIVANAQEPQVIFPRQGALLSLLDLEYDRSLRVNYLYRICLQQENVLGLVGVSCHHLEVEELPVPIVEPLVPPGPYTLPRYGRWLNLELEAVVPKGCVLGDAPMATTFLSGQAPEPSHSLTLEEPLRPLQAAWSFDAALRTVYQQQAPAMTVVADAQSLGQDKTGSRSVDSRLSVEPGTFSAGFVNVHAGACINASKNLTENEISLGMLPLEEVCGYYTFVINVQDLPAQPLSSVSSSRRASAVADQLLAAAAAGANLRLVGLAPSPGAAPEGPPLQAEEGKTPVALQHLDVLEDPQGNSRRAELLQFGWLGAVEPENDTTIIGAIPLAPTVGDNQFTQAELQAGLATLTPVVSWSVQAETRTGTQVATEPPVPSVGGAFLSIPPQQLSPGSQVQVTAQLDLLPPNAGTSCMAPLRSMSQQATLTVGLPPASGYVLLDRTQVVAPARFESFVLESMRWSSQVLPLQYRMEAEFSTGQRVLLNDWSYDPKLSVVLLPRAETVQVRGQVRDGRGVFSVTAPEKINLLSKAGAEDLRVLTEFQQGGMSRATYSARRVSETLKTLESEVSAMDPALQLQLWQDVAFAALSGSFNGTLTNCTEDCGPRGQCPSLETTPRSCDCSSGWLGTLCEIQIFEVASQELITRKVLVALQLLLSTHLEVLGITSRKGAFARVIKLLRQVGADCRRLPADVMASLTALAAGLAVLVPKVALRDASAEMADLMSQLYLCLPEEPAEPMANMPAPATVLLTSLGSSQICRTVGAATTLCYDLASSDVTLSCNISASQAGGALVESHCRVDLTLGLSDPYPCPCPVPNDPWLGFGRSGEAPLSETLGARSEKDILWRELLKRFWNSTAYTSNLSAPGPALAAALWLQEIGASDSQVVAALAKAEQTQLIQQGVLLVLKHLAQLLADALLIAAVPGQAPSAVSSLPVVAHWDMPTVVPGAEAAIGKSRNGTAVLFVDTAGTTVEVELDSSYQLLSTRQLPSILPFKVPMGALHWNYAGRGLFSQMDPSIKVHSDVVQLRLLESQQYNLTKLRYRFMVPEKPSCSQQRPAEDLLLLCCNASNDTTRPGTFASLSCPTSASSGVVQARRVAESPRVLTLSAPAETQAGSVVEIVGKQAPFEQGLESLLDDTRFWTPTGQTVLLAGTHIRLRGGDLKVARACDSQGNAAPRLILKEGQMLQEPEDGYYADAWCRTVFTLARAKQSSAQSWQTFANLLLEAAEEVLADPSVVPTSTTATISSSTRTMSTSTSSTKSSVSTTSSTSTASATYTSSSTITITSTGILHSSTSTSVSVTHSSSSTSISFTSSITRSTSSTTEAFNGTTTMTLSTTTPPWCTRADADPAQKDTWCPSGVDSESALPFYADVELSDTEGVLLVDVFSVQFSLNGSSPLAFRSTGAGRLILTVPERSTFFVWAMSEIFSLWVSSWQELHKLSNSSHVLRDWLTKTTTATVSTTMTSTSTTATTSTSTRLVKQFPTPLHSSGLLLGALELAFSDPLEVFSRALAFDLENYNGLAARDVVDSLWADRGLEGGNLLSAWCQVPKLAPAQNLSRIFLALDPAALKIVDDTGLRPLHSVLEALDRGVPSWWNESFWADSAGGPGWVAPLPTTSTMTRTTTSTQDLESLWCPEVDCLPTGDCGLDPSELECVAWSESLRRFVPALGCTLVAEPGRRWPLLQSGHFELLCECESWAHHSAMAIAEKRPEMTPFPPQVTIRTREYAVSWYDKVNRYNLRGLAIVFAFIVLALLHLAVAAYAEVRWRMQARWVAMHASRMKGVQVEVKQLDDKEKDFIKRRSDEIRAQGELSAAVVAAEAEAALLQAQSLQQSPMTNTLSSLSTSLDFRHAKDGLATIFQAQGLGDVEDDVVRPAMSQPGPVTPTVSTHIVTSSLKKEAPSIAAVPPPLSGAPSPQTLSLREAAHEEAFQPEAMILVKQPLKERVVNYMHDAAVLASQRCTRKSVWRNCQIHHKIVSLSDDSQTWSFSAPERAAVFHFSLWIQAVSLALVLGGGVDRRPYQDPFCPGAGNEFTLAAAGCLLQASQLLDVALAALCAVLVSAVVQTICRGRSFAVRTQELTAAARERAFTRHFLGPWPSMIMAPQEAKARVWNLFCGLTAMICCCSCCPRLKRRPLLPLHWQPSVVPICAALLLFVLAWALAYYMFFFSSSIYMYEVSRTDTTEVEIVYPPDERSEVAAAEIVGPLQAHLILVPEMQRFLVLLVFSWMMNFFVFEPLLLALHLVVGEPTLGDLVNIIWKLFMVQVRFVSWLCGLCIPQKKRDQASKFLTDSSQRLTKSLSGLAPPAKPAVKICCCRRRSKVVPLAPEDLKETIESEGEEEKDWKEEKGHTPKQVEAKESKCRDGDGAKERDSKENQEDKEEKRKKEKRKKRKP